VFDVLRRRGDDATHDPAVTARIKDMLERRRDEWLRRVHGQQDHRLGYKPEGAATVGLLEQAGENNWEMFTCLNSLRDVEGTVDLVLDQRPNGLRVE
jgi:hypothetical protein